MDKQKDENYIPLGINAGGIIISLEGKALVLTVGQKKPVLFADGNVVCLRDLPLLSHQ